jgi:hypothetical protein
VAAGAAVVTILDRVDDLRELAQAVTSLPPWLYLRCDWWMSVHPVGVA